jgi:hypothetical protein
VKSLSGIEKSYNDTDLACLKANVEIQVPIGGTAEEAVFRKVIVETIVPLDTKAPSIGDVMFFQVYTTKTFDDTLLSEDDVMKIGGSK